MIKKIPKNNFYYSDSEKIVKIIKGYGGLYDHSYELPILFDVLGKNDTFLINYNSNFKAFDDVELIFLPVCRETLLNTIRASQERTIKLIDIRANSAIISVAKFLLWADNKNILDRIDHRIFEEILWLQRETVTRKLTPLKKEKVIDYSKSCGLKQIKILNKQHLLEICQIA